MEIDLFWNPWVPKCIARGPYQNIYIYTYFFHSQTISLGDVKRYSTTKRVDKKPTKKNVDYQSTNESTNDQSRKEYEPNGVTSKILPIMHAETSANDSLEIACASPGQCSQGHARMRITGRIAANERITPNCVMSNPHSIVSASELSETLRKPVHARPQLLSCA